MRIELYHQELKRLREFVEYYDLLDQHIIIGVSGGMDSVFLARMVKRLELSFSIAHINYQLRGKDSDLDQEMVRTLAKDLNVPLYEQVINLSEQLEQGGNLQNLARTTRYQFFKEVMQATSSNTVFIAQHQRDQVETIIRNLCHGAGVVGLAGIKEINQYIYRPILDVPLDHIQQLMEFNNWEWREDHSNLATQYDRNFIRHVIIPKLYQLNHKVEDRIAHTGKLMLEANWVMEKYLKDFLEQHSEKITNDSFKLLKEPLLDSKAMHSIIYFICSQINIPTSLIPEILKLLQGHIGSSISYGPYKIWNERKALYFQNKVDLSLENDPIIFKSLEEIGTQSIKYGPWIFSFQVVNEFLLNQEHNIFQISLDKVKWPIVFRYWKMGDKIQPFGMKGMKKVSRIFIDEKIANSEKKSKIILEDAQGILSILGIKNSERTRVSAENLKILQIKFHKSS